jgi:VWFA-related protein
VERPLSRMLTALLRILGLFLLTGIPLVLLAQTPDLTPVIPPPTPPPSKQKVDAPVSIGKDEITAHEAPVTLQVRVNVVLVRVVVRDSKGKAVTNLKKEDFQLADNRKLQTISSFVVEAPGSQVTEVAIHSNETEPVAGTARTVQLPQRFMALFFDDRHLQALDVQTSQRAARNLFAKLQPTDRVAILTTSGQVQLDFTADRKQLEETLQRIGPRSLSAPSGTDCPPMSFYEAYMFVEARDPQAMQLGTMDAIACGITPQMAPIVAEMAAKRELTVGESEVESSFANLGSLIRRMSGLPGQRSIVMMSPGFFMTPSTRESSEMIDRATRANIVINTIDARGLYVSSFLDASNHMANPSPLRQSFMTQEERAQDDVLGELADGTGGLFIHNRNDIDQGLLEAAADPEVAYILGFAPQNLKPDGKYHHLKVTLTNKEKYTLQARHGYFAPAKLSKPEAAANEEIRAALYSHEELRDLPIGCETHLSKDGDETHLTVSAQIDFRGLKFRKAEDRNFDSLTVATVVFDDNGNLVTGMQRAFDLKLKDATLERLKQTGISVNSDFAMKPGTYIVRLVVRASEGEQMAALNRGVEIPR